MLQSFQYLYRKSSKVVTVCPLSPAEALAQAGFNFGWFQRTQSAQFANKDFAKSAKCIKTDVRKNVGFLFKQFNYILKCADNTYYVGCTNDMDDRIVRHNKGNVSYTSTRLPFQIAHLSIFFDNYKAYAFEKYLKSGSGRAFAKKHLHSF